MEGEAENLKWEGKATARLVKPTAEEVWPLLEDFCSLHKWLPTIDTCFKVDGADGESGLVRYCASTQGGGGDPAVKWCREMLTGIDPVGKWLSYEIIENNMGFKAYEATLRVMAIDGGDELGCQIEWSFVADPIVGLSCEELAAYLGVALQAMARNFEKALELESTSALESTSD